MNKIYSVFLAALSFLFANQTMAQLQSGAPGLTENLLEVGTSAPVYSQDNFSGSNSNLAEALGDTIFEEDWSNGFTGWTNTAIGTTTATWEYRGPSTSPNRDTGSIGAYAGTLGPIQSNTRTNGFMIFDSDFYDNGGSQVAIGMGSSPVPHDGLLTSPNINTSLYPSASLVLTQYLRMFEAQMIIEISNDNFVSNIDTVYNGQGTVPFNNSTSDDQLLNLDISSMTGGANFKFRFRFTSSAPGTQSRGYYFWMIDDIRVIEKPDFDLRLNQTYYQGAGASITNSEGLKYYSLIPKSQADADTVQFGAAIENRGGASTTGTQVTATVTGPGASFFTSSSTAQILAAGASDSINVVNTFTPNGGIGRYDVTLSVAGDSVDDFPNDNMLIDSFDVTNNIYARGNGNPSSGVRWGASGQNAPVVRYDINSADTVTAIQLAFYHSATQTNFRTDTNSIVEIGIWNGAGGLQFLSLDQSVPLASIPFYNISSSSQRNTLLTIPLPNPIVLDPAISSEVIVGYWVRSGYVTVANTGETQTFNSCWIDTDGDATLDAWAPRTFPIRLVFGTPINVNTTLNSPILCNGDTTSISATVSSGAAPYSYLWSNGDTTANSYGLVADTYSITVTDAAGVIGVDTLIISEPSVLSASLNPTAISCNGSANGAISTAVAGGSGSYNYSWSNAAVAANLTGLLAGVYTVTVTDSNGCAVIDSSTIIEPNAITANLSLRNITCNGQNDGSVAAYPSGGTAPYTYLWSVAATTDSIAGLGAGTYSVTITDTNVCSITATAQVSNPAAITVTTTSVNISCGALNDGTVSANVNGGTAPFNYNWTNSGTTQTISNLGPGNYAVTVTDNSGCNASSDTADIFLRVPIVLTLNKTDKNCEAVNNGQIVAIAVGQPGLTFLWSNGLSGDTISNLDGGKYIVTVTATNGCTAVDSAVVGNGQAQINLNLGPDTTACISYTIDAGSGFSTYLWSDGSTNSNLTVQTTGIYAVTVTNAAGCTATDLVQITIDPCVGIEESSRSQMNASVYPNPAGQKATLTVDGISSQEIEIIIVDLRGKSVMESFLEAKNSNLSYEFDMSEWSPGVYLVQLKDGDLFSTYKLLKE